MLKRFLLLIAGTPIILGFIGNIVACQWDLKPEVLVITSYKNAEQQNSEDQLIYHKLQEIYGNKVVATIFSDKDDNSYAYILANLIIRFNLKKIFILDPAFLKYLPRDSSEEVKNSNLIRVLEKFTNVDFYFFNNQIANSIKSIANNIYEFRFDTANQTQIPVTYGAQIAEHFYQQLIIPETDEIDTNKYNFDTNEEAKWIIKIGIIKNIGNEYQQKVLDEFIDALNSNTPKDTVWEVKKIEFSQFNLNYSSDNVEQVQTIALKLYQDENVNFIFNTNNWFNNIIAYAASHTAQMLEYTKTIKFITTNVFNKNNYKYKNINYMLFSYHLEIDILKELKENSEPPQGYQVLSNASENLHAYGLNDNLIFVDSL